MARLTSDTFRRPDDMTDSEDPGVLYVRSYLLIRTVIGVIGIVLPLVFIVGEYFFIGGGVHVRGSLSAYYHTAMRDLFVAGLCVIGFLLATYMSGQTNTKDFWLSLVAGVAVFGVVFFPTWRPGLEPAAPRCGTTPMPDGCSPTQQQFGEAMVANIHSVCAAVFILSLAGMAFLFARREKLHENDVRTAGFLRLCGFVIIGAVVGVIIGELLGVEFGELTPLYLGELVSVWAFGASWLVKGMDLRTVIGRRR